MLKCIPIGPCCPTNLKLYRMANNTLRVQWRSIGAQTHNHTVDLYGTGANYTCFAAAGTKYCDIQEEICGEVYRVVAAPLGQNGVKVSFCQPRTYSGKSRAGMGVYSMCCGAFVIHNECVGYSLGFYSQFSAQEVTLVWVSS